MNQQIIQPAIDEFERLFLEAQSIAEVDFGEGEITFITKNNIEIKVIMQRKSTQSDTETEEI